jgi:curli biogenesis system outer membrane secretion channel CsgG
MSCHKNPENTMTHTRSPRNRFAAAALVLLAAFCQQAMAETRISPKVTIAVSGFGLKSDFQAHYGSSSPDGGLAAMLTTALVETDRFVVVERMALTDVFSEQELSAAGLVRPETAVMPGQLIGARLLVQGHVTEFSVAESGNATSIGVSDVGSEELSIGIAPSSSSAVIGIDVRVLDSTSGAVLASFNVREEAKRKSLGLSLAGRDVDVRTGSFEKTALGKAVRAAIERIVESVVQETVATAWSGLVVDVDEGEIVINAGSRAGVAVGERFRVSRVTKVLRDPATGRILGEREQEIGSIEVFETAEEMAFARFIGEPAASAESGDKVTFLAGDKT